MQIHIRFKMHSFIYIDFESELTENLLSFKWLIVFIFFFNILNSFEVLYIINVVLA